MQRTQNYVRAHPVVVVGLINSYSVYESGGLCANSRSHGM
jgi:hypothetical protein